MLAHYILRGSALFCNSLLFHEHVDGLVQNCGNSSALAMELLQSCIKQSMYCYRKPVFTSWDDKYTNDRGQFMQVYVKKYVSWLHVLITLCTSQGSNAHTISQVICSGGISNKNGKITAITRISANFKLLQVPFSFSRYRYHSAGTVLWFIFWWAGTFSSNSHYRSLKHGPKNAS